MLDESRSDSRRRNAQIPMLIGVTGHRDLASTEVHDLRAHIRAFFLGLIQSYPDVPLLLATSLSEGADLLVTEEALALGIDCCAILPMPLDQYRKEFSCQDAVQRFERALGRCSTQILCVNETCSTDSSGSRPLGEPLSRYAAAGELIASEVFILVALWDGRPAHTRSGTAGTVNFRLKRQTWL